MSTLADLREEVRQLIGSGKYDRCFKNDWTDDAINFACGQVASLLGLTRLDVMANPVNNQFVIPSDAIKVVFMQVR